MLGLTAMQCAIQMHTPATGISNAGTAAVERRTPLHASKVQHRCQVAVALPLRASGVWVTSNGLRLCRLQRPRIHPASYSRKPATSLARTCTLPLCHCPAPCRQLDVQAVCKALGCAQSLAAIIHDFAASDPPPEPTPLLFSGSPGGGGGGWGTSCPGDAGACAAGACGVGCAPLPVAPRSSAAPSTCAASRSPHQILPTLYRLFSSESRLSKTHDHSIKYQERGAYRRRYLP
jgi:hypothetical protein